MTTIYWYTPLIYAPVYLGVILGVILVTFYIERKLSAFIQDRYGPMEVGFYGVLQAVADLLKMLQKEDIIPKAADKWLFIIAPLIIFTAIFMGFSVLPLSPFAVPAPLQTGAFFLLAVVSLDVIGLLMAGWASNNKFSLFGAMRAVSQILSYEVPVGLMVLTVALFCGTLDLQAISWQQGIYINNWPGYEQSVNYLFGLKALGVDITAVGGFLSWNVVRMPLFFVGYMIFYVATLAECNRAPFDIPEGESEIIGGFHTEYSGFRFALFFLAEYAMMVLVSILGIILFFGAWNTPFPNIGSLQLATWTSGTPGSLSAVIWGSFWLISKSVVVLFTQVWVRWTYPRLRVDQLMYLGWKVLTPFALGLLLITAVWRLLSV